jgi:hypothetical protein
MDMPGWHHLQVVELVLVHKVHLVYKDQQVLLVPVMVQLDPLVHKAQLVLLE